MPGMDINSTPGWPCNIPAGRKSRGCQLSSWRIHLYTHRQKKSHFAVALMMFFQWLEYLLPDTCLLAGEVPEVEDARPAHFAVFVYLDLVNEG